MKTIGYDINEAGSGAANFPIGRLSYELVQFGSQTTFNQYNSMGWPVTTTQTTNGTSYQFGYAYNLAGGLEAETYPYSGRQVVTCYDSIGRPINLTGLEGNLSTSYTSGVRYAADGQMSQQTLGNALIESVTFNATRREDISKEQAGRRKQGRRKYINSIEKSKQREQQSTRPSQATRPSQPLK